MTETLALVVVVLLDIIAGAAVCVIAAKWLRGLLLGLVAGFVVEVVRILLAMAIVNSFHGFHSDALGWLVNLRLFNIPIIIGLGFLAGSVAKQNMKISAESPEGLILKPKMNKASEISDDIEKVLCPKCGSGTRLLIQLQPDGSVCCENCYNDLPVPANKPSAT